MSKHRYAARTDENQPEIVALLRDVPGVSVETGHDDILVGYRGMTFWYEIKSNITVSKKTGKVLETRIKNDQKRIREEFKGHYRIVSSFDEIIEDIRKWKLFSDLTRA